MTALLVCPFCGSRELLPIVYGNISETVADLLLQKRVCVGSTLRPQDDRPLWRCRSCGTDMPNTAGGQSDADLLFNEYSKLMNELATAIPLSDQERVTLFEVDSLESIVKGFLIYNNYSELRLCLKDNAVLFQIVKDGEIDDWRPLPSTDSETLTPYLNNLFSQYYSAQSRYSTSFRITTNGQIHIFSALVQYDNSGPTLVIGR